jgi:hypothetical protein
MSIFVSSPPCFIFMTHSGGTFFVYAGAYEAASSWHPEQWRETSCTLWFHVKLVVTGWRYKFAPAMQPCKLTPSCDPLVPKTHPIELPSIFTMSTKSGTQLLNEHQNRGHTIRYEVYVCTGHSENNPQYGCRVWVNENPEGVANYEPSKKKAKEAAALEAAESLLLT